MRNQQFQKNTFKKRASLQQSSSKNDLFQHSLHKRKFTQTSPFPFNQRTNYVNNNKQTQNNTLNQNQLLRNQHPRETQNSININIKSNTKELIETKKYQNKPPSNDQSPIHSKINQQRSFELSWIQNNVKSPTNDAVKTSFYDQFVSGNELFSETKKYGCSFSDIEKLSQLFCQVMLKEDSKRIKNLNSTNQQLKSVCKQIVAVLRNRASTNKSGEKYDDLTVNQIHRIILNYENKNKSTV